MALRGRLKTELDRLEALGVIKKTTEPTEWVLPLVLVEKPNKEIRICMDPMDLNKCIKREHYHLPHKSEILGEMPNADVFSKLDATQGFYQIQLDEESTHLCTVATPFGRYSFRRLPFGVSCAPEIFHAKVAQLFEQVQGVRVFMADIVIWGRNREEHENRLKEVLQIIRGSSLCFPVPMFPGPYVPRPYVSRYLCSPVPMFPGPNCCPYVPRSLCSPALCFPVPMFPGLLLIY